MCAHQTRVCAHIAGASLTRTHRTHARRTALHKALYWGQLHVAGLMLAAGASLEGKEVTDHQVMEGINEDLMDWIMD